MPGKQTIKSLKETTLSTIHFSHRGVGALHKEGDWYLCIKRTITARSNQETQQIKIGNKQNKNAKDTKSIFLFFF